ncbi:MAG: hypothetical protein PHX08_14610 [Lachnospiraceae bacterium]|nr:hypothetical protein [Lachnospiraceae bacterium]
MSKLKILVCNNYSDAFQTIIQKENYIDVSILPYPCICEDKKNMALSACLLEDTLKNTDDLVIVCSSYCDILKAIPPDKPIKTLKTNHCFNHLVNEGFANYIIEKGGYIVSNGWLANWETQIEKQGFDREMAQDYYKSFCKELVCFDLGKNTQTEFLMAELSDYLGLSYTIIEADLDKVNNITWLLV